MPGYPFTGISATDFRVSNREDLLFTVSVFDDDLNQPVDMSGVKLAGSASFTGSSWTVTDGTIVTASTTTITIPAYPNTGQLSALALTVGLGLNILPGDQITISDPTGLNTMTGSVVSYAGAIGALVVQVGWVFEFEIRRANDPHVNWNGYVPWYDWGTSSVANDAPIISATLGTGISLVDIGYIQVRIPASTMWTLRGGTYHMALVGTDGFDTREVLLEPLHVEHGGIKQNAFSTQPAVTTFAAEF